MMLPSNRVRFLVTTQPIDFRKGHDGLAALVSSVLRKDPFTGTVFGGADGNHPSARASAFRGLKTNHFRPMDR